MKKVVSMLAVAVFLCAANVNAQEQKPKEKKECCAKGKKCSKDKKTEEKKS